MSERIGTHFTNCWKDGGYRHYACAVAEAKRQREALQRVAWHYHAMHLGCNDDDVPGEFAWEECTEEHCSLIRAALGEEAAHGS